MADDTDEGLIRELAVLHARTRVGDEPATGRLIALLYGRVRAYVRRRLDRYPPDVVADAVHEAMAAVVEQLPSCRAVGGRQLVRWAVVVGWHAALRFVQSPAAGTAVRWDAVTLDVIITVPGDGQSGGTVHDEVHGGEPASGVAVHASAIALLLRLTREAWDDLGPDIARLVWRRAAGGWSYAALAAVQGTTPAAAKRRYQRAVARLRRAVLARIAMLPEPAQSSVRRHLADASDDAAA